MKTYPADAFARFCRVGCLLATLGLFALAATAQTTPLAVPTFHNIGLYWKPSGASASNTCTVEYRVAGSGAGFASAQPLWFDPTDHGAGLPTPVQDFQYRGSIVNLVPDTNYEIRLTLASNPSNPTTIFASTRPEAFPAGTVTTLSGSSSSSTLTITQGGTASAYRIYRAPAGGHTIDVNNGSSYCIDVQASYVIIRGLTLANATTHGIRLGNVTNVVIEDCEIYGWGRTWGGNGLGVNLDSAIYSESASLYGIVVQRNRIRDPRYRSNSWSELNEDGDDHPEGPQAITFKGSLGGHIIRYNDFSMSAAEANSLTGKRYNDVMGETDNFSYRGFPGPDSDIYGNVISGAWDDGIEAEGGNANVRIFGNYITRSFIGLGMATNSLGPIYVFRNIADQSQRGTSSSHSTQGGSFIKLGTGEFSGTTDRRAFLNGLIAIYHNTVLQPVTNLGGGSSTGGYYGIRSSDDDKLQYNVQIRNNILQSRDGKLSVELRTNPTIPSGHLLSHNVTNAGDPPNSSTTNFPTYLYYLGGSNGTTVTTTETGGQTGTPTYGLPTGGSLAYQLTAGSVGHDDGVALANFNDDAAGAPDIGAHERGKPAYVYGATSNWTNVLPGADTIPPSKPGTPVASAITSSGFTLNWTGSTDNVGVQGYDVLAGSTLLGTNVGASNTTFVATGLTPSTTYAMTVVAFDAADNETASDPTNVQTTGSSGGGTTVQVRIATGSDDAEQSSSGAMDLTSSDLELVQESSLQTVGLRFPGLSIPGGATIQSAYVQFKVDESSSGATSLTIHAQAADNAPTFTTSTNNLSSSNRPRTSASVAWSNVASWGTVGAEGAGQRTPDLSAVVQEVVNRSGWTSNNALVLLVSGSGSRVAESFEGDSAGAPLLVVEYTTGATAPAGPSGLQATGVSTSQINLTWTDNATNETAYAVERSPAGTGSWTVLSSTLSANTTSYSATGLAAGTSYDFRVRASNGIGNSPYSGVATAATSSSSGNTTVTRTVGTGSDDAEQSTSGGMNLTSSDLELLYDGGTHQLAGVRFTNVTVPKNATIVSAKLTFTADPSPGSSSGQKVITIKAHAADNSATFSTASGDIANRTGTTASATWTTDPWSANQTYDTPALAAIVQEMVNRSGWSSGNAMTFLLTASNTSTYRRAVSYDGSSSDAPVLTIVYQ